jgi:8-amino-7-oxononanoate synthase
MHLMESPPGPETIIDGRQYLYFAGTGYLGLQGHPQVLAAACDAMRKYGIGTATSRSGFGTSAPLLAVEATAATFFGTEDSFYFPSGYAAARVVLSGVQDRHHAIFIDETSHYSDVEAANAKGYAATPFRRGDVQDLKEKLARQLRPGQRPLVMTDGIFAVSGRLAPLADYVTVLQPYEGATLCVDDAHAFGVLGASGRGSIEEAGLWNRGVNDSESTRLLVSGTLSKALGGYGGMVPGAKGFVESLKKRARLFDGASPPPAPVAAATATALRIAMAEPQRRQTLRDNAALLRSELRRIGLTIEQSPAPIVGLEIGSGENMRRIRDTLLQRGVAIAYFAAYAGTGPEGILRIAVFATHTAEMIRRLIDELRQAV